MNASPLDTVLARSRALDLSGLDWNSLRARPLSPATVRTLHYRQDIETHTVVYLRTLLSTRAIDDPEIAAFLAGWLYEETFHGLALAKLLDANGTPAPARKRSRRPLGERLRDAGAALLARAWPDFVAVHMLWGAINELTTLTGYRRLARLESHPLLSELLGRIIRDESRHFAFYYEQARRRLERSRTSRVARGLVRHFWAPVGSGIQQASEVRFLAGHLFTGSEGRGAAGRVDAAIRALPGLTGLPLLGAWIEREVAPSGSIAAPNAMIPRRI